MHSDAWRCIALTAVPTTPCTTGAAGSWKVKH